jgi:hypothetical protein
LGFTKWENPPGSTPERWLIPDLEGQSIEMWIWLKDGSKMVNQNEMVEQMIKICDGKHQT